jgi:hypothetical protein
MRDLKNEQETSALLREDLEVAVGVADKEMRKRRSAAKKQKVVEQLLQQADRCEKPLRY